MSLPFAALFLALPGLARAGFSADTELLRPTYSPHTIPGVDSAELEGIGAYRAGLTVQYLRDPLILREYGEDAGAIVANRIDTTAGFSYDVNRWFSARLLVPAAYQTGTDLDPAHPAYAEEGFGLADLRIGARAALPAGEMFHPGLRLDLEAPTGRKEAYLGEEGVRVSGGLLAMVDLGPAAVLLDGGFTGRQAVETDHDFKLASELVINGGVLLDVWPERVTFGTAVLSRSGSEKLWQGGAENAAEVYSNLGVRLNRSFQLDVGAGRGLTQGYGATGFRTLAALTFVHLPPQPPPEVVTPVEVTEIAKPPPEPVFEEPKDRPWDEGQLARVEGLRIEIRDPILFEFGTPIIRPISYPTLQSVAEILKAYGQIDHLLVEGHASEEGSFEYNYNLSTARAQAIYNKLIEYGVHPSRLSFRGMGEVAPVEGGASEEALAANRRVNFNIIRMLDPLAPIPSYPPSITLPWSGEAIPAVQPGSGQVGADAVKPRAQPSTEKVQEDFFNTGEEGEEDAWPLPSGAGGKGDESGSEDKEE